MANLHLDQILLTVISILRIMIELKAVLGEANNEQATCKETSLRN